MKNSHKTPAGRALEINQDKKIYGTFAEIGAGQEVARHFFLAGQASQTIAKTISAYDMAFSDEIYGKEASGRYVCESRLSRMLDKEYSLLVRRLGPTRGPHTQFFAFANTVATGDQKKRQSHGWMGIRFQVSPLGGFNDIVLHIRLLDKYRLQQQETLGILGVNLVSCAFFQTQNIQDFLPALTENIKSGQVSIDMIRFSGPDLGHMNNRLMNLELVRRGLADAILFGPDENILNIGDSLYGQSLVIERGHFRPLTNSHWDLMQKGLAQFQVEFPNKKPFPLFEITMNSLEAEGEQFQEQDFLDRVRTLCATGYHVLVSNHVLFYRLKRFLRQSTSEPMAMIIGAQSLPRLFEAKFYQDLEGGMLEGLGKLMDENTHVLVYPSKSSDSCMTLGTYCSSCEHKNLVDFFTQQKWLRDMSNCDEIEEFINSNQILEMIRSRNPKWKQLVPAALAALIEKEALFVAKGPAR